MVVGPGGWEVGMTAPQQILAIILREVDLRLE